MSHRMTSGSTACALVVMLVAAGVSEAQSVPSVDAIVDRLGAYLLDYEKKVFELAADEEYDQWIKRRSGYGGATVQKRKLRSTYFLVRLPDGQAWYGFRDVASVDGRAVAAAGRQMEQLLGERTLTAYEEALALTRASAKYNIGDVYRTINIPLQTLELLHPQYRKRFDFSVAGRERVRGQDTAVVRFNERAAPSLINDGFGGNLLASGRIWVEPGSGAVLRTELGFSGFSAPYLKDAQIRVEYQRDPRLQFLVPIELEETYGLDIEVVHGRASYRNYRRFETAGRLVVSPQ
ncbi:MAG TPA: hypothetical protein VFS23_29545 [Vicinamibacterales bacterium]|nr:hypothetical protein [Vicinamibacterales bacterium]